MVDDLSVKPLEHQAEPAARVRVIAKPMTKNIVKNDPTIAAIYASSKVPVREKRRASESGANNGSEGQSSRELVSSHTNGNGVIDEELLQVMWAQVKQEMPADKLMEAAPKKRVSKQDSVSVLNQGSELSQGSELNQNPMLDQGSVIDQSPVLNKSNSVDSHAEIPYLHELPASFQNSIPSINYSNHIYSNTGGAVTLNGKLVRNNDLLNPNLAVQQILADGVILKYQDTAFKLSELSSWVNMQ